MGGMTRAVFVTHPQTIGPAPGGAQVCTDEFLRAFRAGGFEVTLAPVEHDRRILTRLRRRLAPVPYPVQCEPRAVVQIAETVRQSGARLVLLNLANLAPVAPVLAPLLPSDCRIVLLSHGLESVDYLHIVPFDVASARHERELGRRLLLERDQRRSIDYVLCLTEYEAEIERWLGARAVTPVPRTVPPIAPLDWRPDPQRLGFVGTLDHPPTQDGLHRFLAARPSGFAPSFEIRVAGGPDAAGRALAARFPRVRYLGPLPDDELAREAATWSAFLHPLFCWAKGCSTKMAVALAWQLPIVTTPAGARGYPCGVDLQMADHPARFAELACAMTDRRAAERQRRAVIQTARAMPTIHQVGALLARTLDAVIEACA